MIFKQYGTTYQTVELNFDSKALNEVGFRRDRQNAVPVDEFLARYEKGDVHELVAEAEGPVQDHTEQQLLDRLEAKVRELESGLAEGHVLLVENEDGHDYPKTRQKTSNVVDGGESRLHFHYTISPALRLAVYRTRD